LSDFRIVYFGPSYIKGEDSAILRLLNSIREKHGIDFQIIDATGLSVQSKLYDQFFNDPPSARLIYQRLGVPPSRLFRTNGKGPPRLRGTIAVARGDSIQWCLGGEYVGATEVKSFLGEVLDRGLAAVENRFRLTDKYIDEEQMLRHRFIEAGVIKGDFVTDQVELQLGNALKGMSRVSTITLKYPDLVCRDLSTGMDWVFEIEKSLNYQAIGQVILYEFLYHIEYPGKIAQKAIICQNGTADFFAACICNNIQVFFIPESKPVPPWEYFDRKVLAEIGRLLRGETTGQ
jgi:hypothetical protein